LDAQRQECTVICTDPATGLEVRCVAITYRDFPTVEWTVYFKNTGSTDTPILWDIRDRKLPYDDLRREINAWRDYAQNYSGDFYPLTPPGVSPDAWIGWQFHRPEAGRGVVQAFRRDQSVYESARLKLRSLEAAARYRFTDLDHPAESREFSGAELMQIGLAVAIVAQPGAAVITYEKIAPARQ
jgi:alpha-galactosidase